MLKIILLSICTFVLLSATAQVQTQIIGDSVFMHSNTGKSELILQNSTDTVSGFLFNNGAGRTAFRRALVKINDSLYLIGADTLNLNSAGGSGNGWGLTGNSGTTTANYIGTSDNQPLVFKQNNLLAGRIGLFLTTDANTSFGLGALSTNTGNKNAAFGFQALVHNTSASANTAIGYATLYNITTGTDNTAVGWSSSAYMQTGLGNTAIGSGSLGSDIHTIKNGNFNTALGFGSLLENYGNNYNIGLGYNAGKSTIGSNTFYVSDSTYHMYYQLDSASGAAPTIIGKDVNGYWHTYQSPNVGGGISQIQLDDSTISAKAFSWNLTGNSGTLPGTNFIGTTDAKPLIFKSFGVKSGFIGGGYSTAIGYDAYSYDTASIHGNSYNTAFGARALHTLLSGSTTINAANIAVGYNALGNTKYGHHNTVIGTFSMNQSSPTSDEGFSSNTSIGAVSLSGLSNGIGNVSIGDSSLLQLNVGNYNIGLGQKSGWGNPILNNTLAVSDSTYHFYMKLDSATGTVPSVIGKDANGYWHVYQVPISGGTLTNITASLPLISSGGVTPNIEVDTTSFNTGLFTNYQGSLKQNKLTVTSIGISGSPSIFNDTLNIPNYSASIPSLSTVVNVGNTTTKDISINSIYFGRGGDGSFNSYGLVIGNNALTSLTTNNSNVAIGGNSLGSLTSGSYNFGLGGNTLTNLVTGSGNVAIGPATLGHTVDGKYNVAIGFGSDKSMHGNYNTYIGNDIMGNIAAQNTDTTSDNVFIGYQSARLKHTGSNNTFVGLETGYNNFTGNGNVFLGYNAGFNDNNSNKLYIANSNTSTPLIGGDFSTNTLNLNGTVNILDTLSVGIIDSVATPATNLLSWNSTNGKLQRSLMPSGGTPIILTTNGTIGVATLVGSTLNVPNYANNSWSLGGNAGTNPSTNFIGTTDNQPLIFKSFGGVSSGFTGGGNSIAFGYDTYTYDTASLYGFSENTALGMYCLRNLQRSSAHVNEANTAVGYDALGNTKYGYANTALGYFALGANSISSNNTFRSNVAVGSQSLISLNNGIGNVAIGDSALKYMTTGNFNIALGQKVQWNNTSSNNTFYISDSTYHGYWKLDSLGGTAPSVIGKDANGYWHTYANASGSAPLVLTTTRTSGTATLANDTLNIPNYTNAIATTSTTGVVSVGAGLVIDSTGKLATSIGLFKPGSVPYAGPSGSLIQDTTGLVYDGNNLQVGHSGFYNTVGLSLNGGRGQLAASGFGLTIATSGGYPADASKSITFYNSQWTYLRMFMASDSSLNMDSYLNISPHTTNKYNLGSSSNQWNNVYANQLYLNGVLFTGVNQSPISGTATLISGTVTVSTTLVKAGAKIFVSVNTPGGTQGFLSAPTSSIIDSTSFTINSSSSTDASTINWQIIN